MPSEKTLTSEIQERTNIKYQLYLSEQSDCGNNKLSHPFVAGPKHDVEYNPLGNWPWMASIGYYDPNNDWIHQCGATLISSSHFLTAAHCVANHKKWLIHVGDFNLAIAKTKPLGVDLIIKNVIVHSNYTGKSSYFDVSVIATDAVEFSELIRPICLPLKSGTNRDFHTVDLLGWGSDHLYGPTSQVLKRVTQTIYPEEYCNDTHSRKGAVAEQVQKVVPDLFQSHVLCAGYDIGNQGPCRGDSGGPLQFHDRIKGRYVQVAIVHGSVAGCGDVEFPSVYVRLDDPEVHEFIISSIKMNQHQNNSNVNVATLESESESDWHFIATYGNSELNNWKTGQQCFVGDERVEVDSFKTTTILFNGVPIFCVTAVKRNPCYKFLVGNKKWVEFSLLPSGEIYDGLVHAPGKGIVLFRSDFKSNYLTTLILGDLYGQWKAGPKIIGLETMAFTCVLQLNQTTTIFIGRFGQSSKTIPSYDWSTNSFKEIYTPWLLNRFNLSCAVIKDEQGKTRVAAASFFYEKASTCNLGSCQREYSD